MREIFPTRDAGALCRGTREDEKREREREKASNYLQVAFSPGEFKTVGAKRTIEESSNIIHRMNACVYTCIDIYVHILYTFVYYILYVYIQNALLKFCCALKGERRGGGSFHVLEIATKVLITYFH